MLCLECHISGSNEIVIVNCQLVTGDWLQAIWEGTSDVMLLSLCDVRDVCRAHVLAAELDSAAGRYLVAQTYNVSSRDITDVLAKRFPQYAIKAGKAAPKEEVLDNSKVSARPMPRAVLT